MTVTWARAALFVICLGAIACEAESPPPFAPSGWPNPEKTPPVVDCAASPNRQVCNGHWSLTCGASGAPTRNENCYLQGLICSPGVGCRVCNPNAPGCSEDNELYLCDDDGHDYEVTRQCALGTVCNATINNCIDLCAAAESSASFVGCDYWAVTTSNTQLSASIFEFEVVVANPQLVNAVITVSRNGEMIRTLTVAPQEVERMKLPWVEELVATADPHTAFVEGGAYHVTSSVPVTVYQFNPMEFRVREPREIASYTNDASLLLPSHVLTGNYTVMSRASLNLRDQSPNGDVHAGYSPGFVAIVGVENRQVEVEITASAFTLESPDGVVPALMPGQRATLLIGRGDVIQIVSAPQPTCEPGRVRNEADGSTLTFCVPDPDYDLTGTIIRASGKVSVISGHDCSFVPFDTFACDHLEESLFPEEAWGKVVPISISARVLFERDAPDVVRVVSARDDNDVTFQPPVHEPITLQRGEYVELISDDDFVVSGSEAIMVAQFLVGQDYGNSASSIGDPAMSLGIPSEQWRNNYAFMIPGTYEEDFVNVIAPLGAEVTLDDALITDWQEIEGSGLYTARVAVSRGQHTMSSPSPFGITLYGYAAYTSYSYPGGLDLRVINGPE